MHRTLILTLALLSVQAHAALRPGTGGGTTPTPTAPPPTNPVPAPPTGGGSPTMVCLLYPLACVQ